MSRQVRMSEAWRPGKVNMHRAGKRLAAAPAERLPGLYDPANERDSCGVGFIVNLRNEKSHRIVEDGLRILENLEHRGAVGADPLMGDGAGIMVQIPHAFFAAEAERLGFALPPPGDYAVGHIFMPQDADAPRQDGGGRRGGHRRRGPGPARLARRAGRQCLPVARRPRSTSRAAPPPGLHRPRARASPTRRTSSGKLYIVRKVISARIFDGLSAASRTTSTSSRCPAGRSSTRACSSSYQLGAYYADLHDRAVPARRSPSSTSASRPTPSRPGGSPIPTGWSRTTARSTRCAATSTGWRRAQASVDSELFGNDISKLWPISYEGQSDTACFDNALEFLIRGGYSLPHAAMMLIPEAWAGNPLMDEEPARLLRVPRRADGAVGRPGRDGLLRRQVCRRDARPERPPPGPLHGHLRRRGDHGLGGRRAADRAEPDRPEVAPAARQDAAHRPRRRAASSPTTRSSPSSSRAHPYGKWLARTQIVLEDLPRCPPRRRAPSVSLLDRQQAFGYTQEDLKILMAPMAATGQEAVGSMGNDAPISALSDKSKLLYTYFKQNFAQVTNPPIDSIREELVMSLVSFIGPRPNLFDLEGQGRRKRLEVRQPILTNEDLEKIRAIGDIDDNPVPVEDARHHLPRRQGRRRHGRRARPRCASGPRSPSTAATTSSSCPTAWSVPTACRFRRCSPPPASIIT